MTVADFHLNPNTKNHSFSLLLHVAIFLICLTYADVSHVESSSFPFGLA